LATGNLATSRENPTIFMVSKGQKLSRLSCPSVKSMRRKFEREGGEYGKVEEKANHNANMRSRANQPIV